MGLLTRTFTPELVDFLVDEAGAREERPKSLPSTLMVYFVLAMWLFTGQGYGSALRELVENWPRRMGEVWRPAGQHREHGDLGAVLPDHHPARPGERARRRAG